MRPVRKLASGDHDYQGMFFLYLILAILFNSRSQACTGVHIAVFFALLAWIGDNATHPSGSPIFFPNGKVIATASHLVNGCMA
jgi:hypothetical protein